MVKLKIQKHCLSYSREHHYNNRSEDNKMFERQPKKCKWRRELVKAEWIGGKFESDEVISLIHNVNMRDDHFKTKYFCKYLVSIQASEFSSFVWGKKEKKRKETKGKGNLFPRSLPNLSLVHTHLTFQTRWFQFAWESIMISLLGTCFLIKG